MGYYIDRTSSGQVLGANYKARQLVDAGEGIVILRPSTFKPNLVCVVENGFFDAAAYCYSEREMREFMDPADRRGRTWMIVPNAAKLSGYAQ